MVVLKPNVVRGGRAIGLGNNLYLMKGRTHSKGGIDIGKNPKTGLEVENNEVMQVSPQGVRVFSAQPILGGISPAQYILGGANPNQVFNAQEQWKKINRVNDDGTRKARFGTEEDAKRDSAQVNIFRPSQDNSKVQANRIAHRKSLEQFVKNNPTLYGINTADFVDFMLDNATMESNNSSTAKHGTMYGYYQLKGLKPGSTEEQQHKAAYKHLSNLFKNVITDADISKAKELGISQAQLLHKFWNQERKVLNYLYQGKDDEDGLGTKISEWGNNNNLEIDYSPYVMKSFNDRNYIIQKGDNPETIMKRYRGAGNETRTFNNYEKDAADIFGLDYSKPLQVGQELSVDKVGPRKLNGSFEYGGRIIANNFISNFRKILPVNLLKTIASTAHSSQRHDSFSLPSNVDPGNYFLLDYDRQEKEFEKLGYKKIENEDYGLVKKAVTALEKDTNKKIPIYKKGRDNASRDTLEVIYNGMSGDGNLPKEGELIHAGNYPYAIYKGKNSNKYYVKSWDLNDYGNHNNKNGTTYKGIRQKLANIYDKIGNPFVQTTGIKRIHKWDGLATDENHLQYKYGGIHIKPSKRGTFTAAAKKHGMSVQGFASKVLANKGKYSSAMVKKARFAKSASKWKHKEFGGDMDFNYYITKDNIYKLGGRKKALIGDDMLQSSLIVANNGSNLDAARNKVLSSLPTTKSILTSFRDTLTPVEQKINKEEALRTIMSNQKDALGTTGLSKEIVGQYLANGVQTAINIGGNIGSYLINRDALRRMRGPAAPLPLRAETLPTRVSTAAQEAALRENVAKQENLLAGNLSSSRSRLNATNQIRNQGIGLYNQLQDRKGEIERELITRDKLNRQGITNQNIAQVNQWRNAAREFENKRIDLNSENTIQHLIQGPADAIAGERGFFDNLASNDRYRMTAFLEAIKNPDALRAMNSDEIKQLARRFGVRTSWLRSIGINI